MDRPTLALTLGDPAGIGPEIMAKALAEGSAYDAMMPVVVGVRGVLEQVIEGVGLDLQCGTIDSPADARGERGTVDLIEAGTLERARFGEIDAEHGRAALDWIEKACALDVDGVGLVTGPDQQGGGAGGRAASSPATPSCSPTCSAPTPTACSRCSSSASCGSSSSPATCRCATRSTR